MTDAGTAESPWDGSPNPAATSRFLVPDPSPWITCVNCGSRERSNWRDACEACGRSITVVAPQIDVQDEGPSRWDGFITLVSLGAVEPSGSKIVDVLFVAGWVAVMTIGTILLGG